MTLLEHIQETRPDVLWISGPDSNGNFHFDQNLSNPSEIEALIDSYDFEAAAEAQAIFGIIAARRLWAENMMERLKFQNIQNDATLAQSLWIHTRLRKLEITPLQAHADAFPPLGPVVGVPLVIDLMNLVISGDLETAYATLLCVEPDPMTEPYHALDQNLIDWIKNEIAVYLGWV